MILPYDANPKPDGIFGKDNSPNASRAFRLITETGVMVFARRKTYARRARP